MGYYKHNLTLEQWNEKKKDIVSILVEEALLPEEMQKPLTYKDLCAKMKTPPSHGPNSYELRDLLDEIDRDEDTLSHGLLTAFVFNDDLNRPGDGFFTLAKKLNYKFENTELGRTVFTVEQMRRVSSEQREIKAKNTAA